MDKNKNEYLNIRIESELKSELQQKAKKRNMALSKFVIMKLEQPELSHEMVVQSNLSANQFINLIRGLPLSEKDKNIIEKEVQKHVKTYNA